MNWRRQAVAQDSPHGDIFYVAVVVLGSLGAAFFYTAAMYQLTDSSLVWRIVFAAPAVFFIFGVLQALERLILADRPQLRSAGLTEGVRLRFLVGRWVTLVVALAGCGLATVVRFFGDAATQDVCDDLRILFFSLIFLCYCLADLAGEKMFSPSMLTTAWQAGSKDGSGGLAKKKRPRRSLY